MALGSEGERMDDIGVVVTLVLDIEHFPEVS
jgi:hypothetical protein